MVASGVGGVPVPLFSVSTGPGSSAWYVTAQEAIVCPAGGVIVALIAVGTLMIEPSPGDGVEIVGGGGAGVQVRLTAFDISGRLLTWADARSWSTPAAAPE